jgi:hypothetical protein
MPTYRGRETLFVPHIRLLVAASIPLEAAPAAGKFSYAPTTTDLLAALRPVDCQSAGPRFEPWSGSHFLATNELRNPTLCGCRM